MRHPLVRGVTVALALAAMPTVAAAQQRAEHSAATPSAPEHLPPPVLGREAPWRGGTIPPGYVRRTAGRGFVIGGVVTFLGGYIPMAIGGAAGDDWRLAVPVVGPFLVGAELLNGTAPRSCSGGLCLNLFDELNGVLLIAQGIAQVGGIALLVCGLVNYGQVLRYEPARAAVRSAMAPGAAGAPLGLTFSLVNL